MISTTLIICVFTFSIHFVETIAYALRIAGIKTKHMATALSLITSILLISRLSNMLQAPILGLKVDLAIQDASNLALFHLENQFRIIIFAAFLGSLLGGIALPLFSHIFIFIIEKIKQKQSLFQATARLLIPSKEHPLCHIKQIYSFKQSLSLSLKGLPKQFLIYNIVITAIYTIGVLCSLLASAYLPEYRATAIQLSGAVNGIATILLATIVDPIGAQITDSVYTGKRQESVIFTVVFFLVSTRLLGTLILAQFLLKPFSHYLVWITKSIVGF